MAIDEGGGENIGSAGIAMLVADAYLLKPPKSQIGTLASGVMQKWTTDGTTEIVHILNASGVPEFSLYGAPFDYASLGPPANGATIQYSSVSKSWIAYSLSNQLNPSQATVPGTTGGTATYQMPWRAPNYKIFTVYLNGYENDTATDQVINFPVAFLVSPDWSTDISGLNVTASTTALTIKAPNTTQTFTGWIFVRGY